MVDVVFIVDDTAKWHAANRLLHPDHYTGVGGWGERWVQLLQGPGAAMYYNTLLPMPSGVQGAQPGQELKYGVISTADLLADCAQWRTLYMAGRLHKPIRPLQPLPSRIAAAQRQNLAAAAAAASLMLPPSFTAWSWLCAITGLSYTGDFRMLVGEHPAKVSNIVEGNLQRFGALYAPFVGPGGVVDLATPSPTATLARLPSAAAARSIWLRRDASPQGTQQALACLPPRLQACIRSSVAAPGTGGGPDAWRGIARATKTHISRTVAYPAGVQSFKGLLTAGWQKSAAYAGAKLQKQLRALLRR